MDAKPDLLLLPCGSCGRLVPEGTVWCPWCRFRSDVPPAPAAHAAVDPLDWPECLVDIGGSE